MTTAAESLIEALAPAAGAAADTPAPDVSQKQAEAVPPPAPAAKQTHQQRREAWLKGGQQGPAPADKQEDKPKEEPPAPEKKDVGKYSKEFAALVRERSETRKERETIRAERTALAKEREEFQATLKLLKEEPLDGLEKLGLDYNTLTKSVLSRGHKTPEQIAAEVTKKVEASLSTREEALKAEQAKVEAEHRVQQSTVRALEEISQVVSEGEFPFCQALPPEAASFEILQEMTRHFQKTQEVLDYGTAIAHLESRLEDQHNRLSSAAAKKAAQVQAAQAPATGAPAKATRPEQAQATEPTGKQASAPIRRTLANVDATDAGSGRKLHWKEKRERWLQTGQPSSKR